MISLRVHIEPLDGRDLSRPDRLVILRSQLTLLCQRCEIGLPVLDSLRRAEWIARTLELEEVSEVKS